MQPSEAHDGSCDVVLVAALKTVCFAKCRCAAACVQEKRCAYRILVGKFEGKRPLGRP
jgi:hypothetical protein